MLRLMKLLGLVVNGRLVTAAALDDLAELEAFDAALDQLLMKAMQPEGIRSIEARRNGHN